MCTYETELVTLRASGKGRDGWQPMTDATIYFDHPVHFPAGHAVLVDIHNPALGPASRIAFEMDRESARALAEGLLKVLASAPSNLD